jgi:hypothetical protein
MMVVEDLLEPDERWRTYASLPEMDPLTEADALQEAQLLDLRFDALRSTVGLLFELRVALQLREANTGVLVARGVRELSWTAEQHPTGRTAWVVLGSSPEAEERLFRLNLLMRPKGGLRLRAESAAFFAGDVAGLDQIPDYGEDDEETVRANLAGWRSEFVPMRAVFLDAAPS